MGNFIVKPGRGIFFVPEESRCKICGQDIKTEQWLKHLRLKHKKQFNESVKEMSS